MKTKIFLSKSLLVSFLLCLQASAQLSTQETPISFSRDLGKETIPIIVMPKVDTVKLKKEDAEEERLGVPPRFGFKHTVKINLMGAGKWHTLDNGDKICQLAIVCPSAYSINFLYDKFWLPTGAKFFIYNKDKRHHIGAFTENNNKGTRNNMQGFATGLVSGDTVMLEYYLPKGSSENGIISISGVVHAYKPTIFPEYGYGGVPGSGFGTSGNCQVNINCSEGANWQNEKRAVALIVVGGTRWCSGALINNTNNNYHPYFLTADHCLNGHDAVNSPNMTNFVFYWNYELHGCSNQSTAPNAFSTAGATVLANWQYNGYTGGSTDFALLRLTENPAHLSNYMPPFVPYYLGWDRTTNVARSGVGIYHPNRDVKKIATFSNSTLNYGDRWGVYWAQTNSGFSIMEGGASGSPTPTGALSLHGKHKVNIGTNFTNQPGSSLIIKQGQ